MSQQKAFAKQHNESGVTGYINAGGRGTRLFPVFAGNTEFAPDPKMGIGKALVEVGTPPIKLIDHHIGMMSQLALRNIVVGAGDRLDVKDYVEDRYSDNNKVSVIGTQEYDQLGTGGDLVHAVKNSPDSFGEQVLVQNVDTILDIENEEFIHFALARSVLSIALTRNEGVPNQGAFYVDKDDHVIYSAEASHNKLSKETAAQCAAWRGSSTGAVIIQTDFLQGYDWTPRDGQLSLYSHIMEAALRQGGVAGYDNGHRFFVDIGTEAAWNTAVQTGTVQPHLFSNL